MSVHNPRAGETAGQFGLPGCPIHVSIDAVSLVLGNDGRATLSLPIPDQPALVGMRFHQQAIVLDAGAGNALGAVRSDAAQTVIGRQALSARDCCRHLI